MGPYQTPREHGAKGPNCLDKDGCGQREEHVPRPGDDWAWPAEWWETVQRGWNAGCKQRKQWEATVFFVGVPSQVCLMGSSLVTTWRMDWRVLNLRNPLLYLKMEKRLLHIYSAEENPKMGCLLEYKSLSPEFNRIFNRIYLDSSHVVC